MKKMIGLAAMFIAIGMLIMLLLTSRFIGMILMAAFALIGYYALFCDS